MSPFTGLGEPQHSPTWRKQDWAYAQLREWIVEGHLREGQKLDEATLADELGVSRIPLRHALSRLASEGLVVDRPHRSLLVATMSLADAEDVYAGRTVLEVLLATTATLRAGPGDVERVRAVLEVQAEHTTSGRHEDSRHDDRNFHFAMYETAQMAATFAAFQRLRLLSERYIHLYLKQPSRLQESVSQHRAIFDAFVAGDPDRVADLTERHVTDGIRVLRTLL
ncbi:GntR family transcriptional regulator [Auraticoccus monumenti]|uniref:DNA-binding transcriptional regulator, GntR family n=1 Tax=Auraticoccus monumenti TaxID=675864 RepID=A0A1G7EYN6_9ACTN|nr:GntR family transcriptional regulator [Auraticoccus monumenti]SDE68764.1 DNA-binding transcriptional regulator, GntR family [Auraticoccus monumenti]